MRAVIYGTRGQGKSTLAVRLGLTYHHTVIVFDPNAQVRIPGAPVFRDPEAFQDWALDSAVDHGLAVYRPDLELHGHMDQVEEAFTDVVDIMWRFGNYALVVDEASTIQRPGRICPALEKMIRQAPRHGDATPQGASLEVSLIQNAHRPSDIHSLCRALATDTFMFRIKLVRDLNVLEEQFGADVARQLPALPQFHLLHAWDAEGQERWMRWNDPASWFLPIAAK